MTDAPNYRLNAVLKKEHRRRLKAAVFAYCCLADAERYYSSWGEASLVRFWTCKKMACLPIGHRFVIRKDYQVPVTLLKTQGSDVRLPYEALISGYLVLSHAFACLALRTVLRWCWCHIHRCRFHYKVRLSRYNMKDPALPSVIRFMTTSSYNF